MANPPFQLPLSNVQAGLLKLFSAEIPDKHLLELKYVMAKFLLEKGRDKADAIWDEKGYSDEQLQQIIPQSFNPTNPSSDILPSA